MSRNELSKHPSRICPETVHGLHILEDSTVPGYAIVCLACGKLWRHGPRQGHRPVLRDLVHDDEGGAA